MKIKKKKKERKIERKEKKLSTNNKTAVCVSIQSRPNIQTSILIEHNFVKCAVVFLLLCIYPTYGIVSK